MCETCGCTISPDASLARGADPIKSGAITVLEGLLAANDRQALHNRAHFDARGALAVNLMSSPGAGKTRLLEATIDALRGRYTIAVIEGDLDTDNDARRIRAKGVAAHQITTGTACHLDAHMVHEALHHLALDGVDLVFIENVGNLVCPASFDLGQHYNVTLLASTEGDDKPAKYPVMFRAADLVLLTKTDLLPLLDDFDRARAEAALRLLATDAPFLALSAKTGEGLGAWLDWLQREVAQHRRRWADEPRAHAHPHHVHGAHAHDHGESHPHPPRR